MSYGVNQHLSRLVKEWENIARRAFLAAEHEKDPKGKALIEHGAHCYYNCARDLKAELSLDSLDAFGERTTRRVKADLGIYSPCIVSVSPEPVAAFGGETGDDNRI